MYKPVIQKDRQGSTSSAGANSTGDGPRLVVGQSNQRRLPDSLRKEGRHDTVPERLGNDRNNVLSPRDGRSKTHPTSPRPALSGASSPRPVLSGGDRGGMSRFRPDALKSPTTNLTADQRQHASGSDRPSNRSSDASIRSFTTPAHSKLTKSNLLRNVGQQVVDPHAQLMKDRSDARDSKGPDVHVQPAGSEHGYSHHGSGSKPGFPASLFSSRRSQGSNDSKNTSVAGDTPRSEGQSDSMSRASSSMTQTSTRRRDSSRNSSKCLFYNFQDFAVNIENEKDNPQSACRKLQSFQELFESFENKDSIIHCLQLYGIMEPYKIQTIAIPTIIDCFKPGAESTKSCCVIQGTAKGKTASAALALLAAVDHNTSKIQAIVLSSTPKRDFENYFAVFSMMHSVNCVSFVGCPEADTGGKDDKEDSAKSAEQLQKDLAELKTSQPQIVHGHPKRILPILSSTDIDLTGVRVLILDDAEDLIAKQLVDQAVKICNALELRVVEKVRYVLLSNVLSESFRKSLRVLRSSLMRKRNLFNPTNTAGKLRSQIKHYCVAQKGDWVSVVKELQKTLGFPRAIIFCDATDQISDISQKMKDQGMEVTLNESGADKTEGKQNTFEHFLQGTHSYLLTTSEPAVCQWVLPKVSWVFHFDIRDDDLSGYATRLLTMDTKHSQQGVSVLFVEDKKKKEQLENIFGISFLELPFEFIAP